METVFKVGDVVYDNTVTDIKGEVVEIITHDPYMIKVEFEDSFSASYTFDGRISKKSNKTLSFTPYKIEVNQERPIELPEVGEEIMVSNDNIHWFLVKFASYNKNSVMTYEGAYRHFKRLR